MPVVAALLAGMLTAIVSAPAARASVPTPVVRTKVLGYSAQGRRIIAYQLGNQYSHTRAVILGQMHGDEHAGVALVRSLIHATRAVTNIDLWVIPTMNPDGNAANTRQNGRGVDLNRNWPYHWVANTKACYTGPDPLRYAAGCNSGPKPLSEPESTAMYAFLKWLNPRYLVSIHQPLNGVDTTDGGTRDPAFRDRLAHNLGLPDKAFRCWSVCHGTLTGSFTHHLTGAAITVEFGFTPSTAYLTGSAAHGIVAAMGGGFAALSTRNPLGRVEHAYAHGSAVHVSGWTLDPDDKKTSLTVGLYDASTRIGYRKTSAYRADINDRYDTSGYHGYGWSFAARNGTHTFCLVYMNVGAGSGNTRICRTVTVHGSPRGHYDSAASPATATVHLAGWAFDPDNTTTSINVSVTRDGAILGTYIANVGRADVDSTYSISGEHGFDLSLDNQPTGTHTYCVTAINIGSTLAPDAPLGCTSVPVTSPPGAGR